MKIDRSKVGGAKFCMLQYEMTHKFVADNIFAFVYYLMSKEDFMEACEELRHEDGSDCTMEEFLLALFKECGDPSKK